LVRELASRACDASAYTLREPIVKTKKSLLEAYLRIKSPIGGSYRAGLDDPPIARSFVYVLTYDSNPCHEAFRPWRYRPVESSLVLKNPDALINPVR